MNTHIRLQKKNFLTTTVLLFSWFIFITGCSDSGNDFRIERTVFYTDSGQIESYRDDINDSDDNLTYFIIYDSPGSDSRWFTPDDGLSQIRHNMYKNGNLIMGINYSDRGADGQVRTSDDTVLDYFGAEYTDNDNYIMTDYSSTGPDRKWFTGDDVPGSRVSISHLNGGSLMRTCYYPGPGDDGKYDDNDMPLMYYDTIYDIKSRPVTMNSYNGTGNDNTWFTGDDSKLKYTTITYNDADKTKFKIQFKEKGTDGIIDTNDDVRTAKKYQYNSDDRTIWMASYSTPGPDNIYNTDDDVFSSYTTRQYDSKGRLILDIDYNGPGVDGIWNNSDDNVEEYKKIMFSDSDNSSVEITYDSAEDDNLWFTDDDRPIKRTEQHLDTDGKLISKRIIKGPGADGQWGTEDDLLESKTYWVN